MFNNFEDFRIVPMSGKSDQKGVQNNIENKKQQKNKSKENKETTKQQNKTNSNPKSTPNEEKTNQKSNQNTKSEEKKENSEKSKSDGKKKKKTEDKTKTKNEVSDKQSNQKGVKSNKNPKEEVVKPNLKKTDKKTLTSSTQEFQLSVEKIKKLKDSGYKQLEPIGEGSYGKVFKAKSTKHKKQVAIKVVDLKRLTDWFKKKYLSVEIELMKKIKEHKNVIKFYEVIEATDDHLLYISMEICLNGDLFDYIIRRHYIPEREAFLWFKQLMSGVQHIHKNGFAHRDIKCENILFDDKYNIKIIDFGFCCKIRYNKEDKTVTTSKEELPSHTFCGSLIYSSPEILTGQPYLPTKADIWSSGVVLYVMLFGRYPNDGKELERFIQMDEHCIEVPESPPVSEECKQLVENILVDEPNRYTIKEITSSKWFLKKWEPIESKNITEYFETLNIPRIETLEFEYTPERPPSADSDAHTDLKAIGKPRPL